MSLFDLVIGRSGWPMGVVDTIYGVQPDMCPRYRDHWLEREGDEEALILAVYTRTGGGNREEYVEQNAQMQALPTYVSDADDTYDSTYATFRFRLTREEMLARIQACDTEGTAVLTPGATPEDSWNEMWSHAEPKPRDMSVIWEAMIATLPGNFDEKV